MLGLKLAFTLNEPWNKLQGMLSEQNPDPQSNYFGAAVSTFRAFIRKDVFLERHCSKFL